MVEFDALSGVAILMVVGLLTFVWYTWNQDKVKAKIEKEQKQTLIFEQVKLDDNARPPKSWKHMNNFPLKKTYDECVAATSNTSQPAMQILMQRAIMAVKRIYEHQHFHTEVVASKAEGLVKDEEWQEFIGAKEAIEAECAEIEKVAEKAKEGFGKEIFKIANSSVQAEQKQLQTFMEKRKKELDEEKDIAIVGEDAVKDESEKGKKVTSPKNALANRIAFWNNFTVFPLKPQFAQALEKIGPNHDQTKNILLNRTIFVLKRISEHQQATREVVVARNNGLCKDEEWQAVVNSKQAVEAECKNIEEEAEKIQKGLGKGIFQMAQQALMQEQKQIQTMLQKRKEMIDLNEKKKKEAKEKGETFTDDLAKKQKEYWQSFKKFPVKEPYQLAVKKSGAESPQAKDMLVKRCVYVLKKVLEHQQVTQEIIPARNAKLVSDDEWKDFNEARTLVEAECKEVESEAEKLKPGFGKQIFSMSHQLVMQEKQKMAQKQMQERQAAAKSGSPQASTSKATKPKSPSK